MLDPKGRREVLDTITLLNKDYHITIVLITHHMDEAIPADRVIVLNKGSIAFDGTPKEVFPHVEELRALGLEVPTAVSLLYELKKNGVDLPLDALTAEECGDALIEALKKKKGSEN